MLSTIKLIIRHMSSTLDYFSPNLELAYLFGPFLRMLTLASLAGESEELRLALVAGQALDARVAVALAGVGVASVGPRSDRIASAQTTSGTDISESVLKNGSS